MAYRYELDVIKHMEDELAPIACTQSVVMALLAVAERLERLEQMIERVGRLMGDYLSHLR